MAEFLEQRWLNLLGFLTAVVIGVRVREIPVWDWVSAAALMLILLLPLGPMAGHFHAGMKPGRQASG